MKVTKSQFALLYAQESMFYTLAQSVNFKGLIGDSYTKFYNFVQEQSKLVENSFNINFWGSYNDDEDMDSSHYDIDEALIKEFGRDNILADSYGDAFCVDVNDSMKDKVSDYLKKNYPNLDFDVEVKDEPQIFANWGAAEQFCKDNDIKVELPKGYVTGDMESFINKVKDKQAELARVKKELNDLIG